MRMYSLSNKHNYFQVLCNLSEFQASEIGDFLMGRPVLLLQPNLFGAQTITMEKSSLRCYGSIPVWFSKIRSDKTCVFGTQNMATLYARLVFNKLQQE